MKKYNILIITLLLLTQTLLAIDIQVRIPDTTAMVGDTIVIPVYVDSSLTNNDVISYQLQLQFNSNYITPIGVTSAGTLTEAWGNPTYYTGVSNKITIAAAGTSILSGIGVLVKIQYVAINSSNTYLNFTSSQYNFFNEGEPNMITDNGTINISPIPNPTITVTPHSGLITKGEDMQFNVSSGTAPYAWSLTNPSVASITSSGMLTATSQGFTKVIAEDANGIIDTTNSFIEIRAFKLTIRDTTAWQGSNVRIPVFISDVTALGITSGSFRITFNSNILSPTNYEIAGTLLETTANLAYNTSNTGEISVAFAGTNDLVGSGVLLYLDFEVSSVYTGSTWLSFHDINFNEDLLGNSDNGYFSTINFSNITVSPSSATLLAGETLQFSVSGGVAPHIWSTSNSTVASIDANGLLTAHRSGIIQVTATDQVGATGHSGNITIYDTYVTIPDAEAILNTQFDLPALIGNLPAGEEVSGIQGTISFRGPELTVIDIITEGTLSEGWTFAKMISGNTIIFAGAGTNQFNEAGVMFKIRFQLNPELTNGENAYVNITDLTLSEGIPLPLISNGSITGRDGFYTEVKVNLEGAFQSTEMQTELNPSLLPLHQPFNTGPWNYYGSENVNHFSNPDVVDWVLVELRETNGDASSATQSTRIARKAGLLLKDGQIKDIDGYSDITFTNSINDSLYVVLWHRNHLGVISNIALQLNNGVYNYDFTTAGTQAYGGTGAQVQVAPDVWAMIAGDANADGVIDNNDNNFWKTEAGTNGYKSGDFNLNGEVDNKDKNDLWLNNINEESQVPE